MRRQRGRRTRLRLTTHALKLFGARGYKATTTLAIARAAHSNQSSIRYHFRDKRGLYLSVAVQIATEGARTMLPLLARSRAMSSGLTDARALLTEILQEFARHVCKSSDNGAAASFVARELGTPGIGYDTIYEGYVRDIHLAVTSLLARTTKRFPRAQSAIIDAHALIGAVLGFAAARAVFKQRSFRAVYNDQRIEEICERIALVTAHITVGDLGTLRTTILPPSTSRSIPNQPRRSRKARADRASPNAAYPR